MKRLAAVTASKSKRRLLVAGGLLAIAAALMASIYGSGHRLNWVQGASKVYVVLPATLVTDASVGEVSWSPDGAYCMVESAPTQPATLETLLSSGKPNSNNPLSNRLGVQLQIWDRATNHVKTVWQTDNPMVQVTDITWLRQSSTAYVTMAREEGPDPQNFKVIFAVMALDGASGQFSWMPGMDHLEQPPLLFASPTQPTALAYFDDRPAPKRAPAEAAPTVVGVPVTTGGPILAAPPQGATEGPVVQTPKHKYPPYPAGTEHIFDSYNNIWTLGTQGQVKRRIGLPNPVSNAFVWGKDGSAWYLVTRDLQTLQPVTWLLKDDGAMERVTADLYVPAKAITPDLSLQSKSAVARQRKSHAGYHNVWLSAEHPAFHSDFLISADADNQKLSPTQDSVFYIEGGIAKIRSLVALNDDQKKALYDAARQEAVMDAKQVGLALLMYSADFDDVLPAAGNLDQTDPYLRNMDMLNGFNYTPPGDLNTGNMSNPAQTVLGTVDGPGGQAVVFGDGHTVWRPNP